MKTANPRFSGGVQLPPLGKGGGTSEFERLAIEEITFLVEMVVHCDKHFKNFSFVINGSPRSARMVLTALYPFTASFNTFPALNFGCFEAAI